MSAQAIAVPPVAIKSSIITTLSVSLICVLHCILKLASPYSNL